MNISSLMAQVSADPTLQLALFAMFVLTASLVGGLGRLMAFALMSAQFLRFALLLGVGGSIFKSLL